MALGAASSSAPGLASGSASSSAPGLASGSASSSVPRSASAQFRASNARDLALAGNSGKVVVGAYDSVTGHSAVGLSGRGGHSYVRGRRRVRLGNCAEGDAACELINRGVDVRDIRFTKAARKKRGGIQEMAVCHACSEMFGSDRFPENAIFSDRGVALMRGDNPGAFRDSRARSPSPRPESWREPENL